MVKLPDDPGVTVLYASHTPGDWSKPGDDVGWDGNLAQPTFKPSIRAGDWHGHITHGKLTSKPCDCCFVDGKTENHPRCDAQTASGDRCRRKGANKSTVIAVQNYSLYYCHQHSKQGWGKHQQKISTRS